MAEICVFLCAKQFLHGRIYIVIKQKGYNMNKNFKNWLINNGYKLFTSNNHPSTIFDYLTGVKYVCQWENKTIEQLAESISEVLPKYCDGGEHYVRGRMKSRACRCGLRQFYKFVIETKGV